MFRAQFLPTTRSLRAQEGITGLETAIILIAFVVVASVFAYTVLTAGVFSSQKSSEAVNSSLDEVRSSVVIKGNTILYSTASVDTDRNAATTSDRKAAVTKVAVTVGVALQGVPIDVSPKYRLNSASGYLELTGLTPTLTINYIDRHQQITEAAWTVGFQGANDGDYSLEPTEKAVLTVWLVDYQILGGGLLYVVGTNSSDAYIDTAANLLDNFDPFSLEISPVQGTPLFLEKVVPQSLSDIMNLH